MALLGVKVLFRPPLGGHKIKCQIFSGKSGNRLHFCKMSLASKGLSPSRPVLVLTIYYLSSIILKC